MINLKNILSSLSISSLYFIRNVLGSVNIIVTIFAILALNLSRTPPRLYNLFALVIVSLPWVYWWLAKRIDKFLSELLIENINLDKYEAYWLKHIESKLGIKALAFHALGTVSFFAEILNEL